MVLREWEVSELTIYPTSSSSKETIFWGQVRTNKLLKNAFSLLLIAVSHVRRKKAKCVH